MALTATIQGYLNAAGTKYANISSSYLTTTASIESNFNPNAYNPSGATGLFQFLPSTASQFGVNANDPQSSAYGAAALANSNYNSLSQSLGQAPTDAELYLAHQQGAGGASTLLNNPDTPVVDLGSSLSKNVAANGGDIYAPASDFTNQVNNLYVAHGGISSDQQPGGAGTPAVTNNDYAQDQAQDMGDYANNGGIAQAGPSTLAYAPKYVPGSAAGQTGGGYMSLGLNSAGQTADQTQDAAQDAPDYSAQMGTYSTNPADNGGVAAAGQVSPFSFAQGMGVSSAGTAADSTTPATLADAPPEIGSGDVGTNQGADFGQNDAATETAPQTTDATATAGTSTGVDAGLDVPSAIDGLASVEAQDVNAADQTATSVAKSAATSSANSDKTLTSLIGQVVQQFSKSTTQATSTAQDARVSQDTYWTNIIIRVILVMLGLVFVAGALYMFKPIGNVVNSAVKTGGKIGESFA